LINAFSKVAGFKTNIQKSASFLYTNKKFIERNQKKKKRKEKKPKYLGINLTRR
jgi:hypothetical protein